MPPTTISTRSVTADETANPRGTASSPAQVGAGTRCARPFVLWASVPGGRSVVWASAPGGTSTRAMLAG